MQDSTTEIRNLTAETKEKHIDILVSQGRYRAAFFTRLIPVSFYNYRSVMSRTKTTLMLHKANYEIVRARKEETANKVNNTYNLLSGLLFGEKHAPAVGYISEPDTVLSSQSSANDADRTMPLHEDFQKQGQFQEDLEKTADIRMRASKLNLNDYSLAEPSPMPMVKSPEAIYQHPFATYQVAATLVYIITGVQIGEYFLYKSILTNAYKLTDTHNVDLPLLAPFVVPEAAFLALFISLFSLGISLLFRFLKPSWLINDVRRYLRLCIVGIFAAAALSILFNAAVFHHENKMLRLTTRLDELTRPTPVTYNYTTEITEEAKQKRMQEIDELQEELKPSIVIEVIRYVAISISCLCVVLLSGLLVAVYLLTKYKNRLLKKHQQGVSSLLHLQAEERSQYGNFNTIKGHISELNININKIAVMKNINSQNRQKRSWGFLLLLTGIALSQSACNEAAISDAPQKNDTASVVVLRDISRSSVNDTSAQKTEERIVKQYLTKHVADTGVTFFSYAYIHEQTDVAQNLRTIVLDLSAGEADNLQNLSPREKLLESRRLADRRFQEKQGFTSYVTELLYKEPCTHSGTWFLESVFHLANACKGDSKVHVLVLTDGIQQSPIRSFSNPPGSFAEAEKLAKQDAVILKTKYSIKSDTALKTVEEILILPPMNVDKTPGKGLSPNIVHYYECLFIKGFGVKNVRVYTGQL